jgi:hypothetical protein
VSMWTPMAPDLGQGDDGIPAADPGAGAPPPADGFGVGGEEPDRPEEGGGQGVDEGDAGGQGTAGDGSDDDPPFGTPDPGAAGRR